MHFRRVGFRWERIFQVLSTLQLPVRLGNPSPNTLTEKAQSALVENLRHQRPVYQVGPPFGSVV